MDDQRVGNISFSYDCSANYSDNYSGCYVEYVENCFNVAAAAETTEDEIRIYAPIDTCIMDVSQSYAFKFECGTYGMIYKEFTSLTCEDRKLTLTKNIFDCTLISSQESFHAQNRYFEVCYSVLLCVALCCSVLLVVA